MGRPFYKASGLSPAFASRIVAHVRKNNLGLRLSLFLANSKSVYKIDPLKVNAAILPGLQNYWGEHAAKHKLQMAMRLNNLLCQNTLVVR